MVRTVEIRWSGGAVTGRVEGSGSDGILLAHGAGTNQDHPTIVSLRETLAGAGATVMTFNYPYTERGSRSPDRPERLVACHRAVADWLRTRVDRMFLAGRSMGGRMGTHLAAEGYESAGLVLYAYPLHPAGKPDRLRVAHLLDVVTPMLFFQGTRDALCRPELLDRHIRPLANAEVVVLEGADHSFRGKGWTLSLVTDLLAERTLAWMAGVPSGGTIQSRP